MLQRITKLIILASRDDNDSQVRTYISNGNGLVMHMGMDKYTVPSMKSMKYLTDIHISGRLRLADSIKSSIRLSSLSSPSLRRVYLNYVKIVCDSNTIDSPLEELEIRNIEFESGTMSDFISALPKTLEYLCICRVYSDSSESHNIPDDISKLTNLKKLDIDYTHMNSISDSLYSLPSLHTIRMHTCNVSSISPSISNLTALQCLNLSMNNISELPDSIYTMTNLTDLILDHNDIRTNILDSICSMTGLEKLQLSSNYMSGIVPDHITKLVSLKYLNLSNNRLTGKVPSNIIVNIQSNGGSLYLDQNPDLVGHIDLYTFLRVSEYNTSVTVHRHY